MINLAGVKDADISIKEELYLAGIEAIQLDGKGEVPYTIAGRIGKWKLTRAWRYWIVSVDNREDGLPLENAMRLHYRPNPTNDDRILGTTIRCGGHAGCPSPIEYGAQPVYTDELYEELRKLGKYEEVEVGGKMYPKVSVGELSRLNREEILDVPFYVDSYHIDDQVGLNEFKKALEKYYLTKV